MMMLDARKERERLDRAEAVRVERVLVDVLDDTELSGTCEPYCPGADDRPGYDLAPELLDKLAARGYRLVKIDPFEPVRVGPVRTCPFCGGTCAAWSVAPSGKVTCHATASFAQTSTTNPADLIKSPSAIWMNRYAGTDPADIASRVVELTERVELIEERLATWVPQEQA